MTKLKIISKEAKWQTDRMAESSRRLPLYRRQVSGIFKVSELYSFVNVFTADIRRTVSVLFPDDEDSADQEQEEKDCAENAEYRKHAVAEEREKTDREILYDLHLVFAVFHGEHGILEHRHTAVQQRNTAGSRIQFAQRAFGGFFSCLRDLRKVIKGPAALCRDIEKINCDQQLESVKRNMAHFRSASVVSR